VEEKRNSTAIRWEIKGKEIIGKLNVNVRITLKWISSKRMGAGGRWVQYTGAQDRDNSTDISDTLTNFVFCIVG